MKRIYRPYESYHWLDTADVWMIFFLVLGFLLYVAIRWT